MNSRDFGPAETLMLELCAACSPNRTLSPEEMAKQLAAREGLPESDWRRKLDDVRRIAIGLAQSGRIAIYRKGRPVDPLDFKGVYRIGPRPLSDRTT